MGVFSCDIWDFEPGARRMTYVTAWCAAEENPYGEAVGETAELDGWDNMLAVVEGRRTVELAQRRPRLASRGPRVLRQVGLPDHHRHAARLRRPRHRRPRSCGDARAAPLHGGGTQARSAQLALQAAIAINNAHAFRRLEEQNRQLRALHEIGDALTSTLVFEEALDVMAREAAEALGVSRCIINEYAEGDDC